MTHHILISIPHWQHTNMVGQSKIKFESNTSNHVQKNAHDEHIAG